MVTADPAGTDRFPPPPYRGATAGFATVHHKELVVAPVLDRVGLVVEVVPFDTDSLGTFSGEVPRPGPAVEVLRTKAVAGAAASGRFGLASEGSFGPDPSLPVTVDVELVGLLDASSEVLVVGRAVSPAPWAVTVTVQGDVDDRIVEMLHRAGLPDQRMIVTSAERSAVAPVKDLADLDSVRRAVHDVLRAGHGATISSDLRADRSPGRRAVIHDAAVDLAERLSTVCPTCGAGGFGPESTEPGLPCSWCDSPTSATLHRVHRCPSCTHEERRTVEGAADPAHCARCNP